MTTTNNTTTTKQSSTPTFNHDVISSMLLNAWNYRRKVLDQLGDPRRDINKECGYEDTSELSPEKYQEMYERFGPASRVVELFPKESWQVLPAVYETEDVEEITPFETAFEELGKSLIDEEGFYTEEMGNPIWDYAIRTDILSGIGSYGVILLGLDDGLPYNQPADFNRTNKINYMRTFPEALAKISAFETNKHDKRYGNPLKYNISFFNPSSSQSTIGAPTETLEVHWTRIIHIADNTGSSEVFGTPRMQQVWNHLLDLRKIYGSSAEGYWQSGFPGLAIETPPQLGGDVDFDTDAIKDEIENYLHGLTRVFAAVNLQVKSLAPQVIDPTPFINTLLEAIAIRMACPIRILRGSERGELASTQDDDAWNDRLVFRRLHYVTPRIICKLINRLIRLRVLPRPSQYYVYWPDLTSRSEQEKAQTALTKTQAITAYIGGNGQQLMVPMDFLTRVMNYTDDEARAITEAAIDEIVEGDVPTQDDVLDSPQEGISAEEGTESTGDTAGATDMEDVTDPLSVPTV